MKRLLLVCSLAVFATAPVFAQKAATAGQKAQVAQKDLKLLFSSKTSEFNAYTTRNNADLSKKAMEELLEMMTKSMNESDSRAKAASGDMKAGLQRQAEKQRNLYTQVKTLSAEPNKNQGAIIEKLRAFLETM